MKNDLLESSKKGASYQIDCNKDPIAQSIIYVSPMGAKKDGA